MHYIGWFFSRLARRTTAYFVVLPIIIALFPFTALGNALGTAYYKLRTHK